MLTDYFDGGDLLLVATGFFLWGAIRRPGSARRTLELIAVGAIVLLLVAIPRALSRLFAGLADVVGAFYDTAPVPFEPFIERVLTETGFRTPKEDAPDGRNSTADTRPR